MDSYRYSIVFKKMKRYVVLNAYLYIDIKDIYANCSMIIKKQLLHNHTTEMHGVYDKVNV